MLEIMLEFQFVYDGLGVFRAVSF